MHPSQGTGIVNSACCFHPGPCLRTPLLSLSFKTFLFRVLHISGTFCTAFGNAKS